MNYALYYPTIEFAEYDWLWSASLIWDRIYRIVPEGFQPDDCENVKELCSGGEIGIPINPMEYAKDIADEFILGLNKHKWHASALTVDTKDYAKYAKMHADKADVKIRQMILAKGGIRNKDWYYIPTEFEALYMTYLANSIAIKNNISIVTDKPAAWTGGTFFKYDGQIEEFPFEERLNCLAGIVIKDFLPTNILDLTPKDILNFRSKRGIERQRFFDAIKNASLQLQTCDDPKIINDLMSDIKRDVKEKINDYKRSMDILKVKSFMGLKTISFPVATQVIQQYLPIDSGTLKVLSTSAGIGFGLISGFTDFFTERKKMRNNFDYSYLLELKSNWKKVYQGFDYNYYICRQMEEFICD